MRVLFQMITVGVKTWTMKTADCSSPTVKPEKWKVFNDPIHGHIELPPMCVRIIDTPEFQRLRLIKQLGATYQVFPGAAHNRFEHSLGVCYLAGKFVQHLKENQPELDITDQDKLCVQIAGLCHDLGHGPLSHMFQSHFIRGLDPFSKWKHEDASLALFDHLLEKNNLLGDKDFHLTKQDVTFIKELISRSKNSNPDTGRGKDKNFLYEVVSNEKNGVDVDKWDYFARDCYHLGFKNNFDHNRLIQFSRVIEAGKDNSRHICYRDKEVEDIYHMFYSRVILHRRACQHKTTTIIEIMFMEALRKANNVFRKITGKDGRKLTISECIHDMVAYAKLTDRIFDDIRNSDDEGLEEAKQILVEIENRRHYKCVGTAMSKIDSNKLPKIMFAKNRLRQDEEMISREIIELSEGHLDVNDFLIHIAEYGYGFGNGNPVDKVYFYNKNTPTKAIKIRRETRISLVARCLFGAARSHVQQESGEEPKWSESTSTSGANAGIWTEAGSYRFSHAYDLLKSSNSLSFNGAIWAPPGLVQPQVYWMQVDP